MSPESKLEIKLVNDRKELKDLKVNEVIFFENSLGVVTKLGISDFNMPYIAILKKSSVGLKMDVYGFFPRHSEPFLKDSMEYLEGTEKYDSLMKYLKFIK